MRYRQPSHRTFGRRRFIHGALIAGAGTALARPYLAVAQSMRPQITHGLQSGDVSHDSGIVWVRADRPSRIVAEVATSDSFRDARRIVGPAALEVTDYASKLRLTGLPAGEEVFYRIQLEDLREPGMTSEPVVGHFRTAPAGRRSINFVWSGDTAGQGWGINLDWGGMKIYEQMRALQPDFFIHSGDTVYADGPIRAEMTLPDGSLWKNVTLEEKLKKAETLDEFRASYKYNLLDANVQRFNAEVPTFAQWDDHETTNNWYPGEILDNKAYTEKSVDLLSARARRAFLEYMPVALNPEDPERIYRSIHYGPLLDVFFIDMRSYRGRNSPNRQTAAGPDTAFLGDAQLLWLKQQLLASRATWNVIASDMPVGLMVRDGDMDFENLANGDGPALGRELEIANLLTFIRDNAISNVVWLTADVHYTAAHFYDPTLAQYRDFAPFWEFVTGPLNAGTFGPNELDNTFGPKVVFQKAPPKGQANLPPSDGLQFFGQVRIDGESGIMSVELKDLYGEALYRVDLEPTA